LRKNEASIRTVIDGAGEEGNAVFVTGAELIGDPLKDTDGIIEGGDVTAATGSRVGWVDVTAGFGTPEGAKEKGMADAGPDKVGAEDTGAGSSTRISTIATTLGSASDTMVWLYKIVNSSLEGDRSSIK